MIASTSAQFLANATSTFQNIDWNGVAAATRVWLRSSSAGTEWGLDVPGTQAAALYVNVSDSNACEDGNPNISAGAGTLDGGSNFCWTFPGISISSAANQTFSNPFGRIHICSPSKHIVLIALTTVSR